MCIYGVVMERVCKRIFYRTHPISLFVAIPRNIDNLSPPLSSPPAPPFLALPPLCIQTHMLQTSLFGKSRSSVQSVGFSCSVCAMKFG